MQRDARWEVREQASNALRAKADSPLIYRALASTGSVRIQERWSATGAEGAGHSTDVSRVRSPERSEGASGAGDGVQRPEYQTFSPIHLQTRLVGRSLVGRSFRNANQILIRGSLIRLAK